MKYLRNLLHLSTQISVIMEIVFYLTFEQEHSLYFS